jgi:hypothetical protein
MSEDNCLTWRPLTQASFFTSVDGVLFKLASKKGDGSPTSKVALLSLAGALIFHAAAGKSHSYDFVALVDRVTLRNEPSCHISGRSFSSATSYMTRKQSPEARVPMLPLPQ